MKVNPEQIFDVDNCVTAKVLPEVDGDYITYEIYKTISGNTTKVMYGYSPVNKKGYDKRKLGIDVLNGVCEYINWAYPNIIINCPNKDHRIIIENVIMDNRMDKLDNLYSTKYQHVTEALTKHNPTIEFEK